MIDQAASLQPVRALKQQIPQAPCKGRGQFLVHKQDHICLPSGSVGSFLGKAMSTTDFWNTVKQTNKQTNKHTFSCHTEVLIQKWYHCKDLTDSNSKSAAFVSYCQQSTGYIFYVPHKHLVVSQQDAMFNEAYFPMRVGETMLIDHSTIKTELTDSETNKIDGSSTEPPTGWTIKHPSGSVGH